MRRNLLAGAVIAAAALTVPGAALAGQARAAALPAGRPAAAIREAHGGEPRVHGARERRRPPGRQRAQKSRPGRARRHPGKRHPARHPARHRRTLRQRAAALARTLVGDPYAYGGSAPSGFDCSGLTQYVYRHLGKRIRRTAEDQFRQSRRVSRRAARPGDLVFFHDTSDRESYVYHVGVYEGGEMMVAAASRGSGVRYQDFGWAGDTVTFGVP